MAKNDPKTLFNPTSYFDLFRIAKFILNSFSKIKI